MTEYTLAYELVMEFFKGDEDKTQLWFITENPNLGGDAPDYLFETGRGHKVLQFIKSQKQDNWQ